MKNCKSSIETKFLSFFILIVACFGILPFLIFGQDSVITVHDNLDQLVPYYKMFHDNNLFWKFDAQTKGFDGMSSLYYGHIAFSFQSLLFWVLPTFPAYTLCIVLSSIIAFFSMNLLLRKILGKDEPLSPAVAICFAFLPVIPIWSIGVSTLPLIILLFWNISTRTRSSFDPKVLLLTIFPFFSSLTAIGFFILVLWFIFSLIVWIRTKKFNVNLWIGFIALCLGSVLVDLRLFYVTFMAKVPLNRTLMGVSDTFSVLHSLKLFINAILKYVISGWYHAATFQSRFILPLVLCGAVALLTHWMVSSFTDREKHVSRIQTAWYHLSEKAHMFLIIFLAVLCFAGIGALYESSLLNILLTKYFPPLAGFNWGRFWIFNRVGWYALFALCLQFITRISSLKLHIREGDTCNGKLITISPHVVKVIALLLIVLQTSFVLLNDEHYNDAFRTWRTFGRKLGVLSKVSDAPLSYREFFDENLFSEIQLDISYSNEKVAALGFHPSVLMYNGFSCIDGYNNSYPQSYMNQFRRLIAPELAVNEEARKYYDYWGGRMYLYNTNLDYAPTRVRNVEPVILNIDISVFRDEFRAKYIFSRAEIENADTLSLHLVRIYDNPDSIYKIFLYSV